MVNTETRHLYKQHTSARPSGEGCRTWRKYLAPKTSEPGRSDKKSESVSKNEGGSGVTVRLAIQERYQQE